MDNNTSINSRIDLSSLNELDGTKLENVDKQKDLYKLDVQANYRGRNVSSVNLMDIRHEGSIESDTESVLADTTTVVRFFLTAKTVDELKEKINKRLEIVDKVTNSGATIRDLKKTGKTKIKDLIINFIKNFFGIDKTSEKNLTSREINDAKANQQKIMKEILEKEKALDSEEKHTVLKNETHPPPSRPAPPPPSRPKTAPTNMAPPPPYMAPPPPPSHPAPPPPSQAASNPPSNSDSQEVDLADESSIDYLANLSEDDFATNATDKTAARELNSPIGERVQDFLNQFTKRNTSLSEILAVLSEPKSTQNLVMEKKVEYKSIVAEKDLRINFENFKEDASQEIADTPDIQRITAGIDGMLAEIDQLIETIANKLSEKN